MNEKEGKNNESHINIWTPQFTYVKKIEENMKEGEKKYEMKDIKNEEI